MNPKILLVFVLLCSISAGGQMRLARSAPAVKAPAPPARAEPAAQLPIRRVILYSNGVAYIERRGLVSGDAEINLSFKQSQVDDVLKSMVVLDLGRDSKIGAVSYNSSAPVSARMAEIPFSVNPLSGEGGGIAGVLAQLQGARVAVTAAGGATATGSVLTVERKQIRTEKETVTTNMLVIASETGEISSFDLGQVKSVRLLDEGTRRDLNEFANATASARRRDAKTITITSNGAGQREMIVSYTIAAPIWKTTYRVVLDQEGRPFFQGWAIVDNVSEEDWQNVRLSLVSGSPVSFIQQLQKPFYRYRPVVPTPQDLQLNPQVYEPQPGRVGQEQTVNTQNQSLGNNFTTGQVTQLPSNARQVQNLPQLQSNSAQYAAVNNNISIGNFSTAETSVSDALPNSASKYQTTTVGEEIGDLFEYRIEQPVTVLRDRSALIPIIQTKMDGERVAVYNEAVRRDRPFSGVLLKNLTPLTLEAGSLTVIDGNAYAGEALMERLKAKEQRIISFALDLGTLVKVRQTEDREPARLFKVVSGAFQAHYYQTTSKTYQLTNQTDRPKVVYLEYPVEDGWVLSDDSPQPDYTTQRYYRFRVELKPFAEENVKITLRQALMDSYELSNFTRNDLQLFVSRRYINDETRARLEKLIDLRQQLGQLETRLDSFDDEVEKIEDDQKRLRDNIEALSKTPEAKTLIARYIAKANEQETRLEEMEKQRRTFEEDKQRLQRELAAEIRAFTIQ